MGLPLDLSVIFGSKPFLSDGIQIVSLGSLESEGFDGNADVTTHAVDFRVNASNHIHPRPISIPLQFYIADQGYVANSVAKIVGDFGVSSDSLSVTEKIEIFETWRKSGALLEYSGPRFSSLLKPGFDLYEDDLAITSISAKRRGHGMSVSMQLQKIPIMTAQYVDITIPQAKRPNRNGGNAATKNDSTKLEKTRESTKLKSLLGG